MIPKSSGGSEPLERTGRSPAQLRPVQDDKAVEREDPRRSQASMPHGAGIGAMERRIEEENWLPGITLREGAHPPLNADMGAALERQILLAAGQEEKWRGASPGISGISRGLRIVIFGSILAAVASSGVFFFAQSRKTWEGKVTALQDQLTQLSRDGQLREDGLRKEIAAKDREIAERKADAQNIARIAEKSLGELKTSLDDLRRLREENLRLQSEYREAIRKQPSMDAFFSRWLPQWLKARD